MAQAYTELTARPCKRPISDAELLAVVIKVQRAFRRELALAKEAEERRKHISNRLIDSGELQPETFQVVRFLKYPFSKVHDPGMYNGMTGELFAIVTVISYFVTRAVHPEIFADNPLMQAWGYNNVCVAFDLPPAKYFAAISWTVIIYCVVEYAKATIHRIAMQNKEGKLKNHPRWLDNVFISCHLAYAISNGVFMLCFLIPPSESRQWHTRPFLGYMVFTWLSRWANLKEYSLEVDPRSKKLIQTSSWYYLYIYGAFTLYFVISAEITYWWHDHHPDSGPFFPWPLSMCADWGWMFLTGIGSKYLPATPLVIGEHVFHPGTLESLQTKFGKKKEQPKSHTHKPWCHCCKKMAVPQDMALTPEELQSGREQMPSIENLAQLFGKQSHSHAQKDPTWQNNVDTGITITVLKCRLTIDERVEKMAHWHRFGLLKEKRSYDGFVRIHLTVNGAARFSIRLEVPNDLEVLDENESEKTKNGLRQIDILLAENFEQFFSPMPKALLHLMNIMENGAGHLCSGKLSHLVRTGRGWGKAKADLENTKGVTGKKYYSGLPYALGRGCCKFGLEPRQAEPLSPEYIPGGSSGATMADKEAEAASKYAQGLRDLLGQMDKGTKSFDWDFVVQIGKRHHTHHLDEGDVHWDTTCSPYMPVGNFSVFPEPARAGGIEGEAGPALYFNPWNQLVDHRPIGALQLARYHVYREHWQSRKQAGGGLQKDLVCPFLQSVGLKHLSEDC